MEQTAGVLDVTDCVPLPLVLKVAVKPAPKVPLVGRFVMVGTVAAALLTTAVLSELELPV